MSTRHTAIGGRTGARTGILRQLVGHYQRVVLPHTVVKVDDLGAAVRVEHHGVRRQPAVHASVLVKELEPVNDLTEGETNLVALARSLCAWGTVSGGCDSNRNRQADGHLQPRAQRATSVEWRLEVQGVSLDEEAVDGLDGRVVQLGQKPGAVAVASAWRTCTR